MNILVLETSTTSAKALLYSTVSHTYEVETNILHKFYNDVSLHHPEDVFKQTIELAKKLCYGKKVDIISIVTTWHSLLLCDNNMYPVSPTYLWSNIIANDVCEAIKEDKIYLDNYYKKTGCPISSAYPFFKLHVLDHEQIIADQGSYQLYELTNAFVTTTAMASGTGLLNTHTGKYDHTLLEKLHIQTEQLPEIVPMLQSFPLNKKAADSLGLEEGIPVLPAMPDGAMNQIGTADFDTTKLTISVGTSGALRLFSQEPVLSQNQSTWCYKVDSRWIIGAATSGACNCVDYYKDALFTKKMTYKEIEELINKEKKTKDYLNNEKKTENLLKNEIKDDVCLFMPFMFGERSPGWNNQRYSGFIHKESYSSIERYESVLEGVLFNLYQCYEDLLKVLPVPSKIFLSGGILNSTYWTQMCADVFGETLWIDEFEHGSLYGGVVLGMKVLGCRYELRSNYISCGSGFNKSFNNIEKELKVYPNKNMNQHYMTHYKAYLYYYNK